MLAAHARYAFRQRMVYTLVLIAAVSALLGAVTQWSEVWWVHIATDLCLVGYLAYLRRQVRIEQAIRARRAARLAGARRPLIANDPSLDEWARRGQAVTRPRTVAEAVAAREAARRAEAERRLREAEEDESETASSDDAPDEHVGATETERETEQVRADSRLEGRTSPVDPALSDDDDLEDRPGLPRIRPVPPPERPHGTVVLDDEDPELHDLDYWNDRGYRRAAGQ